MSWILKNHPIRRSFPPSLSFFFPLEDPASSSIHLPISFILFFSRDQLLCPRRNTMMLLPPCFMFFYKQIVWSYVHLFNLVFNSPPGIEKAIARPGPDVVICDEGHRIKNYHASTSQALKNIRSRRRVVLTGYPLQNNLIEYWCMVDFVRPDFLGTRQEFSNMFERPILNGQCMDSTPQDVRLMRYRSHVLHSLLEGFVQR